MTEATSDASAETTPSLLADAAELRRALLGTVLVGVAMVVTLRLMGRGVWCDCGSLDPFAWTIQSSHNSQHLFDAYTPTHALHGMLFYLLIHWIPVTLRPAHGFLAAMTLESLWEIVENTDTIIERYRAETISLDYFGDSVLNSISDLVACGAGYLLASALPVLATVVIFVGTELVLVGTIRDGLLLNIVNLTLPSEWLKQWQAGK